LKRTRERSMKRKFNGLQIVTDLIMGGGSLQVKAPQWSPRPQRRQSPLPAFLFRKKYNRTFAPEHKPSIGERIAKKWTDLKEIQLNPLAIANILVGLVLLVCAIGVVYYSYSNRQQVSELAELRTNRDDLQQQWTYLINDQNSLSEFSRIEKTAASQLDMNRPTQDDIYIIRKMGKL